MTEILFRAQAIDTREWIYGFYIEIDVEEETHSYIFHQGESILVNIDTVSQFIGLDDCHGEKIFEGDIVQCLSTTPSLYEVTFEDGKFSFVSGIWESEFTDLLAPEIMTNIYDSPEFDLKKPYNEN